MANGVYVSSGDGSTITGAGIYIQGDADDMQIKADSSGNQVYVVTQGSTTTTITVNYTANNGAGSTTISSGGNSTTYTGLPTDKSDPSNPKAGSTIVFANGNIWSLRGGIDSGSGSNQPAIASKTQLTITAARSIKVTGDLKYSDPVVNSDGTPVSNIANVKNVLGLFTNDGNIYLDAKPNYVAKSDLSLEIDAADCVFDSNPSDDSAAPYTGQEGGITTWFGSGRQTPSSSAVISIIGSDVEKNNSLCDCYNANEYYDVRFSGGKFAPPFWPGANYSLGQVMTTSVPTITAMDAPAATAKSWFRENN